MDDAAIDVAAIRAEVVARRHTGVRARIALGWAGWDARPRRIAAAIRCDHLVRKDQREAVLAKALELRADERERGRRLGPAERERLMAGREIPREKRLQIIEFVRDLRTADSHITQVAARDRANTHFGVTIPIGSFWSGYWSKADPAAAPLHANGNGRRPMSARASDADTIEWVRTWRTLHPDARAGEGYRAARASLGISMAEGGFYSRIWPHAKPEPAVDATPAAVAALIADHVQTPLATHVPAGPPAPAPQPAEPEAELPPAGTPVVLYDLAVPDGLARAELRPDGLVHVTVAATLDRAQAVAIGRALIGQAA